ncbi:hypothetical protein HN836_02155 [Candidatus Woesearchaeota archaeon]|nr:hypothetical protein [Candidatus Woesearchaeota archaeon]
MTRKIYSIIFPGQLIKETEKIRKMYGSSFSSLVRLALENYVKYFTGGKKNGQK